MIEAPELVTATQRELHNRHIAIHRKFFPNPPVFAKPQSKVTAPPVVAPVEPEKQELGRDWLLVASPSEPLTIAKISHMVAARWNVTVNDIRSARRTNDIVVPRQIVCLLAHILTLKSYPSIGKFLGGRDHTTAMASVRKFNWLGEQLRSELASSAPLETWVNRAFELVGRTACECVEPKE